MSPDEPYFLPFEGASYRTQQRWPGRLLVLGESHYLRNPEKDDTPDYTQRILRDVTADHLMIRWRTPYFRHLFYVLTGESNRAVPRDEWVDLWQSIAFYNYVQTRRLRGAGMRPNAAEWEGAKRPFRTVLARLQPDFVIITGHQASGNAIAVDGKLEQPGVRGVWLPTANGHYAFARCIYHPSSRRFAETREEARQIVKEMLSRRWPASEIAADLKK